MRASGAKSLLSLPIYLTLGFNNCLNGIYASLSNIRKNALSLEFSFGTQFKLYRLYESLHPIQFQRRYVSICRFPGNYAHFWCAYYCEDNMGIWIPASFPEWQHLLWTAYSWIQFPCLTKSCEIHEACLQYTLTKEVCHHF